MLVVIKNGYRIPFQFSPPLSGIPLRLPSYSTGSERGEALSREITALLNKDAVEDAPSLPGFYSCMFVVPKVIGGFCPVIDLSHLNRHVRTTKFCMETGRTVLAAICQDDWMVLVDLKDAYLLVSIHPGSRQFLRFQWENRSLQFRTLCFGLSTAPQVFTRMMAPVAAELHRQGIRILRYLDDWLLLATMYQEAFNST